MTDTEFQSAVNKASNALFDVAVLLKRAQPDLPEQNRQILIELAITAWINAGGAS